MTTEVIQHIYKFKRGSEQKIFENDPVLLAGEPIVVLCEDDIVRLKIGDGVRSYNDLPFINQENDQSLKGLIEQVKLLEKEIHDAGDTIYQVNGDILLATEGNSVSKKISNYLTNIDPLERFTLGNTAIVTYTDNRYSDGHLIETYRYDGREWLINLNTYTVDSNCMVLDRGVISLKGFESALQDSFPVKDGESLKWKSVSEVAPIKGVQSSDKFLSVSDRLLSCDVRIVYNNDTNEIELRGKNGTIVTTIDASNFLIKSMLDSVTYNDVNDTITFVWNTSEGKQTDSVRITNILDPYVSGKGIVLGVDRSVSIKLSSASESFLSLDKEGLKVSGIESYIDSSSSSTLSAANKYTDKEISNLIQTYIEGDEGVLEKLQEVADWISNDESGTVQIIQDVADNKASAKRHDTEIDRLSKEVVTLQLEGNTTYEFKSLGEGAFEVRSSKGEVIKIDTQSKEYTDSRIESVETYVDEQVDALSDIYQTEEDVANKIDSKINELELNIIDGGRITDGNN